MAKELKIQTDIVQSVRKDGGYARKMSNRFAVGVPDLLVALYPFAPCLIEVKDLGECGDTFNRQVAVTPKQRHEMGLFSKVYEGNHNQYSPFRRAALVLVAIKHRGEHRLVALPRDAERLDHTYVDQAPYAQEGRVWVPRDRGLYYNISPLLRGAGITKVTGQ